MRTLKFKDGVFLAGLQPEMLKAVDNCLWFFNEMALTMTLTSCRDGKHSDHSHHYKGLAIDIRIWDVKSRLVFVCDRLREILGSDYEVINEGDHIHVEYDPRVPQHPAA